MKTKIRLISVFFAFSFAFYLASCSNEAPVGGFLAPIAGSCYLPGDEILIEATANDNDGSVVNVELQLNGNTIITMNSSPYKYTYTVGDIQGGDYTLTGIATDDRSNTGSWEVIITILPEPKTFTDSRDGKVYRYATIGTQEWMIDNLAWLPTVSPSSETSDSDPFYYVSEYQGTEVTEARQTENFTIYGVLYNWTAANSCCPEGWHLPSDLEWKELESYIDYNNGTFETTTYDWGYVWWELGIHLLHTSGWGDRTENGLNTYGFSVLPGGHVVYDPLPHDCPLAAAGCKCYADFWSSTPGYAWSFWSEYPGNMGIHSAYPKGFGLSVRCVKDE